MQQLRETAQASEKRAVDAKVKVQASEERAVAAEAKAQASEKRAVAAEAAREAAALKLERDNENVVDINDDNRQNVLETVHDPEVFKKILDPEDPEYTPVAIDNHYSPVSPDKYIRLRLVPMLKLYRKRLPRYARVKEISSWAIMLGAVSGTLMSFLGHAPHVAIISSVTSAIAAWMEFNSTAQKISRYNGIVVSIQNILLWWDSIGDVDKASPVNINMLVEMGEGILNAERGAWLSSAGPKDTEGKDKGEKKSASTPGKE